MRQTFFYTLKKNAPCMSLVLLLIAGMVLVVASKPASAAELPIMSLSPSLLEVPAPGEAFTINVTITNVTTMQSYDFKLGFNTSILNATAITLGPINKAGMILGPVDPNTLEWTPLQNVSAGFVWVVAVFPFGQAFTGSGNAMIINFTALAMGNSTLDLYDTEMADNMGTKMDHWAYDGSVNVISKPPLPIFSLNPSKCTVSRSASFTVDVNITDVANLQEYEFKLWFDNALLNATDVIPGPANPQETVFIPNPLQNVSDGFVHAGAILPEGQAFSGSGILMTINFTALAAGNCTLHLNETRLTDPTEVEIEHLTLEGSVTVLPKIVDFHTHHINDATDDFPYDYVPMVLSVNGKDVTIAPVITCTTFEDGVWKPNHHPCKLAQTLLVDDDLSDNDANYIYIFEDWTDYDWNDIVVNLSALTNSLTINAETFLESREAAWKNPFGVEITPMGMTVEVHWNSTDYPEGHIIKVNSGQTVDLELFAESDAGDTAFITIIPLRTYTLTITSTSGGTTYPVLGNYSYEEGTVVPVTAIPRLDHVLDHWELDGVNVGYATSTSVTMNKDHTLHAVFEEVPAPVGGHAIPIDKSHFLVPKINLVPRIGHAFVLVAAMAIAIILIRGKNKKLRQEH